MDNSSNKEDKKFGAYAIPPGAGFILGIIVAILLGNVIPIKVLPQKAQEIGSSAKSVGKLSPILQA